jgi:DNA polymerase-3 subunit beta
MSTQMAIEAKEEGLIAIPAKILLEILKSLPEQPLTFTIDKKTLGVEISSDYGKYKLTGANGEDFPKTPALNGAKSLSISGDALSRAINKTLFAAGSDELRMNLTGLFLELKGDSVNFVATDANKLVRLTRKDVNPGVEGGILIPKKPLNLLKTALPNDETPVIIDYNRSNVYFTFGETRLICRLLEDKYPDYAAVIPQENPNIITISRMALLSSINRISIFASKTTYQVRFKVTGNELTISAEDIEMANEAVEKIPCEFEGNDMEIGFNAKFLKEMLSTLDGEQVQLCLSAPNRAGLVIPNENERDEDITMLIMPMMLNNY